MRLYYYTGPKFALENLKKRSLKISFADEVNDIFELKPFDFGKNGGPLRREWQKSIHKYARAQGFVSFSSDWKSPAMWGHYAEYHKGVCYGFDVNPKKSDALVEIQYVTDLRLFRNLKLDDERVHEEELEYAQKTKSDIWAYEKEWRVYVSLSKEEIYSKSIGQSLFFVPFGPDLTLKEVIIGANSIISSNKVKDALQDCEVEIKTARASFRKYAVVEQMLPSKQA
ncbi:DUF2971 domain-containing protein [Nioella nitratireducens]|uniref:DUF2971 domain-containing protein n=1 Tax=Nioella nitratireducens TaxID=1287720 RepID=UPI000A00EB9B|nr:DUF2971 domain-containing protein [Nioella nitratireducens]